MNEKILNTSSWSSFSFDEKINRINALNIQRKREKDPRSLRKAQSREKKITAKKKKEKNLKVTMSKGAVSLFNNLPDDIKKGLL